MSVSEKHKLQVDISLIVPQQIRRVVVMPNLDNAWSAFDPPMTD